MVKNEKPLRLEQCLAEAVTPHERTRAAAPCISGKETPNAKSFFNRELYELLITSEQNIYNELL